MKNLKFTIWLFALLLVGWTTKAQTIQIGSGTSTSSNLPITGNYGYTYSQQIYTQAQINKAGQITKIRFYYITGSTATSLNWKIYIGHTSKTTFTSTTDWIPTTSMTEVFNGAVTYPAAGNWMEITLTTPFTYNNIDNLVIAVDENTPSFSNIDWKSFTSGSNTGIYYRSDSNNPDPAAPPTAYTTTSNLAQLQLYFLESCPGPNALTATGVTTNSASLSWTNGGSESNWSIKYGTPGFNPQTEGTLIENITSKPYTLASLSPASSYEYYVKSVCGASDESTWVGPKSFTTLCNPFSTPFTESFESTTAPPSCWSMAYQNPSPVAGNIMTHSNTIASAGTNSFRFSSNSYGSPYYQWLISPELNYATDMLVKFKYRKSSTSYAESFIFGTSTSGTNITTDFTWQPTVNTMSTTEWTVYEKLIPAGTKYVSIQYNPGGSYAYVYIDEFSIENPPSCVTPTEQPTALVLTPTAGTITGSYTAAASADSYLVLRTTDATPTVSPVDGTTYTIGNTLGNATIVKAGTGLTFSSTGLTGGTTYYFHVYAMNATCVGGPKYFTTTPLSGSSVPLLTAPASFTANATGATNINLVTTANTDNNNVIIAWNTTSTFGTPTGTYANGDAITGGGTVLYQGAAGNFSHTPLTQGTTYYYKVWSKSGNNYSASGLTANSTTAFSVPYTQNFNASTSTPTGWATDMSISASHGNASNGLYRNLYSTVPSTYASSPLIQLSANPCRIKFDYRFMLFTGYPATAFALSATDKLELQISTNGGTSYSTIYTANNTTHTTSTSFATIITDLSAYSNQVVKFKLLATWGTDDYFIDLDNIIVEEIPSCGYPTALNTGTITTTSAVLNWTAPAEGTPTGYNWIVVARGAGSSATPVSSGTSATNSTTANGLTSATEYDFFVKTNCGGTLSNWAGPFNFVTLCTPATAPTTLQDFSSYSGAAPNPVCWSEATDTLIATTTLTTTSSRWTNASGFANVGSNTAVKINLYSTNVDWIISNQIDLGATPGLYRVKYKYAVTSYNGIASQSTLGTHKVQVVVSTDGGATWSNTNVVKEYTGAGTYSNTGETEAINLTGYSGIVKIAFVATTKSISPDIDFHIDNFVVEPIPTCFEPTAVIISNLNPTGATFSWTAPVNGSPANYIWKVVAGGAASDAVAVATGTVAHPTLTAIASTLASSTPYTLYVKTDCGSGDQSAWTEAKNFTTYCSYVNIPVTENFDAVTTPAIPSCWTKIASTTATLTTSTSTSPNSPLNHVYMYNSYDNTNPLILVAPGIVENLNTTQVKFFGKASGAGYQVILGTMTDPLNASTFTPLNTFNLTTTYTQYEFYLNNYTGSDKYVAFKHANVSTYQSLYLDDIQIIALPTCIKPLNLQATGITSNSANISWSSNSSAFSIEYKKSADVAWTTVTDDASPYTLGSLDPNTSYDVRMRTFCTPDYSDYSSTITFMTNCAAVNIPISQNFDAVTVPAIPDCWRKVIQTTSTGNINTITTSTPNSGLNHLLMTNASDNASNIILVSPEIVENLNTTQVKFYAKSSTAGYPIILGTMTDPSNPATFTALQSFNLTAAYVQYEYLLNTYVGTDKYIAIKHGNGGTSRSLYVDDILIEALPACIKPTNVAASSITATSASINWTNGAAETAWEVQYWRVNYDIDWTTVPTTTKPVLLPLADNAEYNVRVRSVCDEANGVYSEWSTVINFKTPCFLVSTFPLLESFDGAFAPDCWKNVNTGTVNPDSLWNRVAAGTSPACATHSGAGMARFNSFNLSAGTKAMLVTPGLNFDNAGGYTVKFWMYRDDNTTYINHADSVNIYYNTASNTAGATFLGTINRSMGLTPVVSAAGWYAYEFALPTGAGGEGYVIFEAVSKYGNNIFLDDIKIKQPSNAKEITALTIPNQVGNSVIDGTAGTVVVTMPYGTDVTTLIPTVAVSEFATIDTIGDAAVNFTTPKVYTVTAENSTTKQWTVTVNVLPPSTEAEIVSFTIPNQVGASEIISATGTINVHMPYGTDRNGLIPTFTISANADVDSISGVAHDFTAPFVYTVTAEDVTVIKPWTVNVIVDPASQAANILTFSFAEQSGSAIIDNVNHTVNIQVVAGTNRNSLVPTITTSEFSTITPASGVAQDFTTPFTYNVQAQDVSVIIPWTVTVTEAPYTLVNWNFPNNPDDAIADGGIDANLTRTIGAVGTGVINYTNAGVSTQSAYALGWNAGMDTKYWQVDFSTQGYKNITLSSVQRSSNTGPRDFKVQYKLGASGTWTNFANNQISVAVDYTTGVFNQTLPTETFNQSDVFIRWIMTSNTSVNGGTVASGGTQRIDDIIVKGVPMMHDAEITSFVTNVPQDGAAVINSANATVTVNVPNGTTITALIPTIGISNMAQINPASGVAQDFTTPISYTVTAEDGTIKVWTVTIIVNPVPTYTVAIVANNGTFTGAGSYEEAANVTLTATPNEGYEFVNWSDINGVVSTANPFTFAMPTNNLNYIANFAAIDYTVAVTNAPVVGGSVVGAGTFNFGDAVSLTATPAIGYSFVNWTIGGTEVSTALTYDFNMPSHNVDVVANYAIVDYTIALTSSPVEGGTTTGAGTYNYNDNVTLTATPATGYEFVNWTSNFGASTDNPNIFTMPASDITGVANFAKIDYTLTVNTNPAIGGTVTGNSPTYNYNDVVSLVATPEVGYEFLNWTINGAQVSTDANYSFNMPSNNVTITANFILIGTTTYDLTLVTSPVNSGNVDGAGSYIDGALVSLTATPAAGYTFVSWTEGVNLVSSNASFTFTMPAANTTLVANFAAIDYSVAVSINPLTSGSVTGEGTTYHVGDLVTLTATPAEGYEFVNWTDVNGEVSSMNPHTFSMPADNVNLTANFALVNYSVAASTLPVGAGTITGTGTYTFGQSVTLETTPNAGYTFVNWTVGGTEVATTTTYTFNMPSNDVTAVANYTAIDYTVAVAINPIATGTVTGAGSYNVGETVTLTATPEAGYTFVNWTDVNGEVSTTNPHVFNMGATDVSLTANFEAIDYAVSITVAPVGAGIVSGDGTYNVGDAVTVSATANAGYIFANWSNADGVVSTNTTYNFNMPASNVALTANFTAVDYSVAVTIDPLASGTVTGAGNYNVGNNVTLVATPAAGYNFANWTDVNGEVSTNATYSFSMPAANVALTAHFVAIDYTVTVNVAPAASGTTTGAGSYNVGESVTLTATPAVGYEFVNWTEGTTVLGTTTPYIFNMPASNKVITANFALITYPLTLQVNPTGAGSVTGAGSYAEGTIVSVSTTPTNANFVFVNWTNGATVVSTTASFSYTMTNAATTLVANYRDETSISENNTTNISVYPNPSNGVFNLVVDKAYDMQIIDVTGRLVLSQKVEAGLSSLHMEQNNVGVYFIRLISESEIKTIRIVKQQ